MKRSQKFKQSSNPLLSWIWIKISVDIKAQGTLNVSLRHLLLPFLSSQKHTVVPCSLTKQNTFKYLAEEMSVLYSNLFLKVDIVHGLMFCEMFPLQHQGLRAYGKMEKR